MEQFKLPYEITPAQLTIYLQIAVLYSKEHNFSLPKAEELIKTLISVNWDEVAILLIDEKPF